MSCALIHVFNRFVRGDPDHAHASFSLCDAQEYDLKVKRESVHEYYIYYMIFVSFVYIDNNYNLKMTQKSCLAYK